MRKKVVSIILVIALGLYMYKTAYLYCTQHDINVVYQIAKEYFQDSENPDYYNLWKHLNESDEFYTKFGNSVQQYYSNMAFMFMYFQRIGDISDDARKVFAKSFNAFNEIYETLFHELLQVLRAADAVLFADVKQRDPAREVLRHGGLLFLGGKVAGLFPGCKAVCTLGFIGAQPLAHGGVADADALRRGLTADLACFDFFHKGDLLLWRQLWSLGHGNRLSEVVGTDCRKAPLVKGRCRA